MKKLKKIVGVIHLLPTTKEFDGFTTQKAILERAIEDLNVLKEGGVNSIIIENNYDLPHKINVSEESLGAITRVLREIRNRTKLPLGISILWNDYRSALKLAKENSCDFIRVPVFVDHVKTDFGEIKGNPEDVISFRSEPVVRKPSLL